MRFLPRLIATSFSVQKPRVYYRFQSSEGFTLVELLVGMALSLALITGTAAALLTISDMTQLTADKAELAERVNFGVRYLADEVRESNSFVSMLYSASQVSPCDDPSTGIGEGIRVVSPGKFSCLPTNHLMAGTELLVVETDRACGTECADLDFRWPAWVKLEPACHPVSVLTEPELRLLFSGRRPDDCGLSTAVSYWRRSVFFIRNYAWTIGDRIGALMVKRFQPETMTFGRAEMLVPGVVTWLLKPVVGLESSAVSISLSVSAWKVDSVLSASAAPANLTLKFMAASRNIHNAKPIY